MPYGERSIARADQKVLDRAEHLVYVEDQYLWSAEVAALFARALARRPQLRLIGVVPMHPDQIGLAGAAQSLGRRRGDGGAASRRWRPRMPRLAIPIAAVMYRILADSDGRPPTLRRAHAF